MLVALLPIEENTVYGNNQAIKVQSLMSNENNNSVDMSCNYSGVLYNNGGVRSHDPDKTYRQAFDELPKDYNIIILTTLATHTDYEVEDYHTTNTSIIKLKTFSRGY